jgi:hypothetical protein
LLWRLSARECWRFDRGQLRVYTFTMDACAHTCQNVWSWKCKFYFLSSDTHPNQKTIMVVFIPYSRMHVSLCLQYIPIKFWKCGIAGTKFHSKCVHGVEGLTLLARPCLLHCLKFGWLYKMAGHCLLEDLIGCVWRFPLASIILKLRNGLGLTRNVLCCNCVA